MVNAIGIIAEYNPFHNGHLWHLNKCLEANNKNSGYTVAVMSGNFVQRGESSIFDKWSRAGMAVQAGVDLVLELPVVFAARSAQYFAGGAVRLLKRLGIVSHICFGAEHPDLNLLSMAATKIDQPEVIASLRQNLKAGKTYAAALAKALGADGLLSAELLTAPNNILAIEYLRAINYYAPHIVPIPILRHKAGHHDQKFSQSFAAASAIRREIWTYIETKREVISGIAPVVPMSSANYIADLLSLGYGPARLENLENIILANLRLKSLEQTACLPEVTEGLEHKIVRASLKAGSIEELLTLLKSKRYPRTRLQRILIHALLGTTQQDINFFDQTGPLYARVLAFNEKGRFLLKEIKRQFPVITKTTGYLNSKERRVGGLPPLKAMLAIDTLATDIYMLGMPEAKFKAGGLDFLKSPYYIK